MWQLEVIFQRSEKGIYSQAKALGVQRSEAFMASEQSGRMLKASTLGNSTRFQKGHQTWNKGLKGFKAGGRSAQTRFKPGNLSGSAKDQLKPVGHERVTKDGILQRKVRADGPPHRRWKSVHSILWEEHNGPVPAGHVVVFKDQGIKHINITLDRLELITRAELALRNTIHRYPPELKAAIRAVAKLKRTINEVGNEKQN
ncbi:HNH endonuclease signature motif containing protein [Halopseudomonas phragmitis]|nr:HNH endonuclease signature motif containing protein [Halopseudomonas phragmitis]